MRRCGFGRQPGWGFSVGKPGLDEFVDLTYSERVLTIYNNTWMTSLSRWLLANSGQFGWQDNAMSSV